MFSKNKDDHFPPGTWQYQEAKAKLSQVMDETLKTGMQIIIRNRKETFIVLSKEKYDACIKPKESLIEFFLNSPYPDLDLKIQRSKDLPRKVDL